MPICPLCDRDVSRLTQHHLIPRATARRRDIRVDEIPTVELCSACHRQLHALYDHRRLAQELTTVEALRAEPEMQRFLNWVRRQPAERHVRIRR